MSEPPEPSPAPSPPARRRMTRGQRVAATVALAVCAPFGALTLLGSGHLGWWDGRVVLDSIVLLLCIGALSAGVYAITLFVFSLLGALLGPAGRDR